MCIARCPRDTVYFGYMQTTSTSKILAIVIGLLVILGGGWFMFMGGDKTATPSEQTSETGVAVKGEALEETPNAAKPKETTATTKASFKDLLGRTGSQKCTITESNDISRSSGVFYTSGGKGRGDFESTVVSGPGAGVTTKNSMILDGDTVYIWDAGSSEGMKMSMTEMGKTPAGGTPVPSQNEVADKFNQAYDYDCSSWKADPSLFVPPAGVTFADFAELMKSMQGMGAMPSAGGSGGGMDMSAMCASCDQTGDGRDACRAALGCK